MRKAIWKQTDSKTETYQVWVNETQDENGNIIEGHFEEKSRIVPIYGTVYEEVEDIPREEPPQMPTPEERILALEQEIAEMRRALK